MQTALFHPGSGDYPMAVGIPAFDEKTLIQCRVDAHWTASEGGQARARASLWHRQAPKWLGERLGVIGHYAAEDPAAGNAILRRACTELAAAGCTLAVGPMDGDTWHSYRFVTETGDAPPFFLEPWQPPTWTDHWYDAGFRPLAEYHSTVSEDLDGAEDDPRQHEAARRVQAADVRVRALEPARWEEELGKIHAVAAVSFQTNFLYTPLPAEDFLALYAPLKSVVRPDLVLISENASGQPVGFALGLPNVSDVSRETFIAKTVAVLPSAAGVGLGRILVDGLHAAARGLGYRRAIHALMHDDNASRHLSARFGSRPLRRYALFSRRLP